MAKVLPWVLVAVAVVVFLANKKDETPTATAERLYYHIKGRMSWGV